MQKCFDCDYEKAIVKCTTCKCTLCVQCNTKRHCLSAKKTAQTKSIATVIAKTGDKDRSQNHKYFLVCEECDQREREFYCQDCDEKFCNLCFTAFHKRGNRINHVKKQLGSKDNFALLLNVVFFDCSKNYDEKFRKLIRDYLTNYKYLMKYIMVITDDKEELKRRIDDAVFLKIVEINNSTFYKDLNIFKTECSELILAEYNLNKVHLFFDQDEQFSNWLLEMYKDVKVNKVSSVVSEDCELGLRVTSHNDDITEMKSHWSNRMSFKSEKIQNYESSPEKKINKCFSADHQEITPSKVCHYSKLSNLLESSNITELLKHPIKHPLYHIFNDIDYEDENFKQYSLLIQQELHDNALNGSTKIIYDRFILYLQNKYEISLPKIQALITKAVDANILYKQIRQLSNSHTLIFLSLKSSFLFSHENFLWIVKSLKKDKMSFTIPMILNRIRDVFDLSINEDFLYDLFDDFIQYKYSSEADDDILFKCLDIVKVSDKNYSIHYIEEREVMTSVLAHEQKKDDYEDLIEVDENSYDFGLFKTFIDHVFTLDLIHINEKYQQITNETLNELTRNDNSTKSSRTNQIYKLSSIDPSSLNTDTLIPNRTIRFEYPYKNKQSYRNSNFASYSRDLDKQSEIVKRHNANMEMDDKPNATLRKFKKVIPGGKYGLALFTKFFGFNKLRSFSIGKILAFIDKAIKCNIIRYSKTFIFRNDDFNFSDEDPEQIIDKDKLFDKLKARLVAVLHENNGQIMIAQAKELIENSEEVYLHEFERFGYTKLKNIVKCYNDDFCIIEVKKGTFIITWKNSDVKLVNKRIEQIASGQETKSQKKNKKKKQKKLAGNSPAQANSLFNSSIKDSYEKTTVFNNVPTKVPHDILYKVKVNIFKILNSCQAGLEPHEVENDLRFKLGMNFDAQLFGYESLYHFISTELKDIVDIEVKNLESEEVKHFIYLKNKKFGVVNKEKYMITNKLSLRKQDTIMRFSQNDLDTIEDQFLNHIVNEHINESSISELQGSRNSFCMENLSQQISYKSLLEKLKSEQLIKVKRPTAPNMKKLCHLNSLGEQIERMQEERRQHILSQKNSETIDFNTIMTHQDMYGYDSKSVN